MQDQAHGILILPKWRRKWYPAALKLKLAQLDFPKGTKFFELHDPGSEEPRLLKGTLWQFTALLFCGHQVKCPMVDPVAMVEERSPHRVHFQKFVTVHLIPP